jgi:hypothetical protein
MTRTGKRAPARGPGFDPELPVTGFYRVKLRKGAHDSVIAIWYGPPADPEGGDVLDRPFAWQASVNGSPCDVYDFWPGCAREPINRQEYDRVLERNRTMNAESPFYDPKKRLELNSIPPPF